jgi:hypothetical protein
LLFLKLNIPVVVSSAGVALGGLNGELQKEMFGYEVF